MGGVISVRKPVGTRLALVHAKPMLVGQYRRHQFIGPQERSKVSNEPVLVEGPSELEASGEILALASSLKLNR